MDKVSFSISTFIDASPKMIYTAWLDGNEHANMTGGKATGKPEEGSEYTAWDGYISGKNITLIPNERIVQSWRTADFDEDDQDSMLEILLKPKKNGCDITLIHTNIPVGQPDYKQGWEEHYFEPMKRHFVF